MHTMTLTQELDGWQFWYCFECGRYLKMRWEPYKRVILKEGDQNAGHQGGIGGVVMGSAEVKQSGNTGN